MITLKYKEVIDIIKVITHRRKINKEAKNFFRIICGNCGCIFICSKDDLGEYGEIDCPDCGEGLHGEFGLRAPGHFKTNFLETTIYSIISEEGYNKLSKQQEEDHYV